MRPRGRPRREIWSGCKRQTRGTGEHRRSVVTQSSNFHVVTIGWPVDLADEIARQSGIKFSQIAHPRHTRGDSSLRSSACDLYFIFDHPRQQMPEPDRTFLAALEQPGVPTIHNIILSDRVVSKLDYREALGYVTFVARRLEDLFYGLRPSVVIGGHDAVHGGVSLAVARYLGIPWYALNFSVIPPGLACFVDALTPSACVPVEEHSAAELRQRAEASLANFEGRGVRVPAYITPPALSFGQALRRLPRRIAVATEIVRNYQKRRLLRFTDERTSFSLLAALTRIRATGSARRALARVRTLSTPPAYPFVLFGLHMQPESTIDVWAPFYSNQLWVIELLSRAIPASHRLLVKIHKSDAANYSEDSLRRMLSRPATEFVHPLADARAFVARSDLVVSIQGTMGLEAALLGKPVIVLGDSPVTLLPSVARIGELSELPALVRRQLALVRPSRRDIVDAYAQYLSAFAPAVHNDWSRPRTELEIERLSAMFHSLIRYEKARTVA